MKWTPGVVQRKIVWSQGLFTLAVRAPDVAPFEAGQFLQLGIPLEDGQHLHRPYSVASPHGEVLEFFVVLVEEGQLTPHLWKMQPGDKIDVSEKAAGSFTLSHCPTASVLWLIGTGTGLAPYIACLRTAEPWKRYERIVLVHGVRHASDLAYQQELDEHIQRFGTRFRYVPVISRESRDGALNGRITTCLSTGSLENVADQPITTDSCIMMCGNPDMLTEMENILEQRGLRRHKAKSPGQVIVERYW
ncbi:MAG: ferredoxin--NADP reductase [Planctomycetales bacterium]|nr:ferredoxin--NADP reductase [Planctomycetales bacterium]